MYLMPPLMGYPGIF